MQGRNTFVNKKQSNKMREMKDSGNVWYGKIPYDWELNKIKYLTTIRSESAFV